MPLGVIPTLRVIFVPDTTIRAPGAIYRGPSRTPLSGLTCQHLLYAIAAQKSSDASPEPEEPCRYCVSAVQSCCLGFSLVRPTTMPALRRIHQSFVCDQILVQFIVWQAVVGISREKKPS